MQPAPRLQMAIHLLLQAHDYSLELGCDTWDFAVEIACLRGLGLTLNEVRWLVYQNYVLQSVEVTAPEDDRRVFQPHGKVLLTGQSCFILTPEGVAFARALTPSAPARVPVRVAEAAAMNGHELQVPAGVHVLPSLSSQKAAAVGVPLDKTARPCWDKDRRMLRFGSHLVKQFKVPAPNQEIILEAFEEENWPVRIDDPLPVHPAIDPKRRLHDTINSLNRKQRVELLHFLGDGSGQAICWELLASPAVHHISTTPPGDGRLG